MLDRFFDRVEAVFKVMFSHNFILIYDIKQRIENGKPIMKSTVQRHTNHTVYEDIETMENALNKVINKV